MTDHEHQDQHNLDRGITRGFVVAISLVAGVAGCLWTNSLALLSDAAHVFMDMFASLINGNTLLLIAFCVKPDIFCLKGSPRISKSTR